MIKWDKLLEGVIKRDKPLEWVLLVIVVMALIASMIISGNAIAQIIMQ